MTSRQALIDELGEDAARDQARAVGLIGRIRDLRDIANLASKDAKPYEEQLKQWLDLNGQDELIDGERGLRAFYQSSEHGRFDVRHMPLELVAWLAQQGLLGVNVIAFRALKKAAPATELDQAERYWIPEHTTSLRIEATNK